MAANRAIMTPVFATSKFLTTFCSLIALAVVSVNGYFLVTFRQDNLPGGAGERTCGSEGGSSRMPDSWALVCAGAGSLL